MNHSSTTFSHKQNFILSWGCPTLSTNCPRVLGIYLVQREEFYENCKVQQSSNLVPLGQGQVVMRLNSDPPQSERPIPTSTLMPWCRSCSSHSLPALYWCPPCATLGCRSWRSYTQAQSSFPSAECLSGLVQRASHFAHLLCLMPQVLVFVRSDQIIGFISPPLGTDLWNTSQPTFPFT